MITDIKISTLAIIVGVIAVWFAISYQMKNERLEGYRDAAFDAGAYSAKAKEHILKRAREME
jgi:hypothetical protein